MAIVRNVVKLRNLKICMESVGMRPYKCSEVKKKKKEDLATHFNVMSLIHEIKASYVSNVVVKRCEEREKKRP